MLENGYEHGGLLREEVPRAGGADEVSRGRSPLGVKKALHQLHDDHTAGWSYDVEVGRPLGRTRWSPCLGLPRASKAPGVPIGGAVVSAGQGTSPGSTCVARRKLRRTGPNPPIQQASRCPSRMIIPHYRAQKAGKGAVATRRRLLALAGAAERQCGVGPRPTHRG